MLAAMDTIRFGLKVRALRRQRGWRQEDLAAAAGVSRAVVGRLEAGKLAGVTVGVVDRVTAAVDASADIVLRWHGAALDRLLDEEHAALVEQLVAILRALGWEVAVEVSFSIFGERGSIDVLAWHAETRSLVVFEIKSVTPDMGAMLFGMDRKTRLAPNIVADRGWKPLNVAKILVLGDTSTNRDRLARHEATIRAALPAGTREVRRWLAAPGPEKLAGVLFLRNARTKGGTGRGRQRVRLRGSGSRTRSAAISPD
jgi:transcriptional regulator with XRE-family HTH domain